VSVGGDFYLVKAVDFAVLADFVDLWVTNDLPLRLDFSFFTFSWEGDLGATDLVFLKF